MPGDVQVPDSSGSSILVQLWCSHLQDLIVPQTIGSTPWGGSRGLAPSPSMFGEEATLAYFVLEHTERVIRRPPRFQPKFRPLLRARSRRTAHARSLVSAARCTPIPRGRDTHISGDGDNVGLGRRVPRGECALGFALKMGMHDMCLESALAITATALQHCYSRHPWSRGTTVATLGQSCPSIHSMSRQEAQVIMWANVTGAHRTSRQHTHPLVRSDVGCRHLF